MPNWKKIILSGSSANLSNLSVDNDVTASKFRSTDGVNFMSASLNILMTGNNSICFGNDSTKTHFSSSEFVVSAFGDIMFRHTADEVFIGNIGKDTIFYFSGGDGPSQSVPYNLNGDGYMSWTTTESIINATSSFALTASYVINGVGGGGISNVVEDTTPQLGGELDLNTQTISIERSPFSDHNAEGFQISLYNYGASTINIGEVVYNAGNGILTASAHSGSAAMPAIGVAIESITQNNAGKILTYGVLRDDSWSFQSGSLVYVGAQGAISDSQPAGSGQQVQIVGHALSTSSIFINPQLMVITKT